MERLEVALVKVQQKEQSRRLSNLIQEMSSKLENLVKCVTLKKPTQRILMCEKI